MTSATVTFGWDTSHYDGHLTAAVLNRAKAQGIQFWTHKLGEGVGDIDPFAAEAFAAGLGLFDVVGGYWFIHGNDDPKAEAAKCVAVADQVAPGWRDKPGWFFQTDAEVSSTGLPSPAYTKAFSDTLADLSGKTVVVYASAGMYGNRLAGLGHFLWNAHYGTNPTGTPAALYAAQGGNKSAGWNTYSDQVPLLLQFGSGATVAGLTTCDANAFRGTIDELLEQIMTTVDVTPASQAAIADLVMTKSAEIPNIPKDPDFSGLPKTALNTAVYRIRQASADARDNGAAALAQSKANAAVLAGIVKTEAVIQAALAAAGPGVDTATLAAQIKAVGDSATAEFAALHKENADLKQENADLLARLAAAEQAAATALANPPAASTPAAAE